MVFLLLIFLIISTGGVFSLFSDSVRYEKMLPVTCTSIMTVLFFFGIAEHLYAGFLAVLFVCTGIYLMGGYYTAVQIRKNGIRDVCRHLRSQFLTPAVFLFAASYLFMAYANYGRLAIGWDEFSHWATTVKQMTLTNTLRNETEAIFDSFQSYPPAMGLFQYFFEEMHMLVSPGTGFSDWLLFFSYQIFMYAFLMPFFSELDFRKPFSWLIAGVVLSAPTMIFSDALSSIYIDHFLGIVSGAGLASLFCREQEDRWADAFVCLAMFTLVLSKDVGFLFAVFLLAAVVFYSCGKNGNRFEIKSKLLVCGGILAVFVPKVLWKLYLQQKQVEVVFTFNGSTILDFLLGRDKSAYRIEVIKNFARTMVTANADPFMGGKLSLLFVIALLFFGILQGVRLYRKRKPEKACFYKCVFWLISVESAVYIVGLLVSYMFSFDEYEAVRLASFPRYINILLNSLWMFLILILAPKVQSCQFHRASAAAAIICFFFLTQQHIPLFDYSIRQPARYSLHKYEGYRGVLTNIYEKTEENSRIYLIAQGDSGYDKQILRYNAIPRAVNIISASIGEPFFDGDIWTAAVTPEEWWDFLAENCDYVVLCRINDYFIEHYGSFFSDRDRIAEGNVYRVNTVSGMIEPVD